MTTRDIVKTALEQFKESEEVSQPTREEAEADILFSRLGEQWPQEIKRLRAEEARPCLTFNKHPSFIRQVVNDGRQNKPGINVHPVDNGADKETAQVIGGLVRSIERKSMADIAYDTALDHAVTGGFGFIKVGIDYCHDMSFDKECLIERVPNPFMIHWDVNSTAFDSSDWDYAFETEWIKESEFKRRYKGKSPNSFEADDRDQIAYWREDDHIRVVRYWRRTATKKNLVMLTNGQVYLEEDMPKAARDIASAGGRDMGQATDDELKSYLLNVATVQMGAPVEVARERETEIFEVKHSLMNAGEVLEEEKEWPGSTIPICPVWGEEVYAQGRRHFRSLVRDARDAQTEYNYGRSAAIELTSLMPKAPWLVPKGAIDPKDKQKWVHANTRSYAYLEYDAQAGPMPQRQQFAGAPVAQMQQAATAADDMKSIMGIYDASLGARSNETSGKAIRERKVESETSNFHFFDNQNRAIRALGKILVEVIPHTYKDRQSVRILGEDEADSVARLKQSNGETYDPETEERLYDMSVGKYDVTLRSGPSYQTQREETREALMELVRTRPDAAMLVGDELMKYLDFVGSEKLARRFELMLPPQIQQAEGIQVPMPPVDVDPMTGQPIAPPGAPQAPIPNSGTGQPPLMPY